MSENGFSIDSTPILESNNKNDSENSSINFDNSEVLNQIITASNLEKAGQIQQAISIYQEILETYPSGTYSPIAQKALDNLLAFGAFEDNQELAEDLTTIIGPEDFTTNIPWREKIRQKFYSLPIRTKQFSALLGAQLISVVALAGISSFLIINSGKSQLIEQSKSELKVAEINFNLKTNQMEFGFKGNAQNPFVIQASASNKFDHGKSEHQVFSLLYQEIWNRQIEIATLVNTQSKIIKNANLSREGEKFNPNQLVTKALATKEQVKSIEIISYDELAQESPRFAQLRAKELGLDTSIKPNFLIHYVVTPVKNDTNEMIVGALISGDIAKLPNVQKTVNVLNGGYSAIYLMDRDEKFSLVTSQNNLNNKRYINSEIENKTILEKAVKANGEIVVSEGKVTSENYMLSAKMLFNSDKKPVAILVRGTPQTAFYFLLLQSLGFQGAVLILAILANWLLANLLGNLIVKPIEILQQVAKEFSKGNRLARAQTINKDEIGELARTFNEMAENIIVTENDLALKSRQQETEVKKQKEEKERLQQEVIKLLLEIDEAQKGDLTVKAQVTDGVVGSIADAFNNTIRNLRQLVLRVQNVSRQVNKLAFEGEGSVSELSQAALNQAEDINETLQNVAQMNQSIQTIASSAAYAAEIARTARTQAQAGDQIVEETVNSIENIRNTVADTSKKVKQLAESSQEISQIVTIISGISEKTNLLAFNASIEAARAGENGQGFRVVADEVRRLADRVTESTKEIQQLVSNIQQETAEVLKAMELGTSEVVIGTELIRQTKQILQTLGRTSQKIDEYLENISTSTNNQTQASQEVNQTIEEIANISKATSSEAQELVTSFRSLVKEANTLEKSIAKFQV
jgi:twitching motility protein PilJ